MKEHEYLKKVEELRSHLMPGTFAEAVVVHEDDCPFFRGFACNCNAEVKLVRVIPKEEKP